MLRNGDDTASIFEIALIGYDADHMVGVEQLVNLTGEEIEITMDINLDLTEVVERARDSVAKKFREGAGWRQLKQR